MGILAYFQISLPSCCRPMQFTYFSKLGSTACNLSFTRVAELSNQPRILGYPLCFKVEVESSTISSVVKW